ncbi:hypothetical protein Tco_0833882 [Tanacetum coccineum]|uniref:Uncharacterized protein n=1 Tax=Tanacetum coccineum TaxID=301880 RepID=A0ABQ4YWX2_9ASTR
MWLGRSMSNGIDGNLLLGYRKWAWNGSSGSVERWSGKKQCVLRMVRNGMDEEMEVNLVDGRHQVEASDPIRGGRDRRNYNNEQKPDGQKSKYRVILDVKGHDEGDGLCVYVAKDYGPCESTGERMPQLHMWGLAKPGGHSTRIGMMLWPAENVGLNETEGLQGRMGRQKQDREWRSMWAWCLLPWDYKNGKAIGTLTLVVGKRDFQTGSTLHGGRININNPSPPQVWEDGVAIDPQTTRESLVSCRGSTVEVAVV